MAESGEGELKRARLESELAVKSPEQVHAAKKLRLEDKAAMDAAEKACRRPAGAETEGEAEGLGRGKEYAREEGEENPLELQKEGNMNRENPLEIQKEGNVNRDSEKSDDVRCMGLDAHEHREDAGEVAARKVSNEAARIHGDLIDEDEGTSARMGKASKEATIGPRCFTSSVEMLEFFYQLLHNWPVNVDINKYEHMMLEDLLKKGHEEWHEKVGSGIKAFQVRINQEFKSRCYYVIRKDGSVRDFSYRKCVDSILSLPKNLKPNSSTSNQNQKGLKPQHKQKGSKFQHNNEGSKTQRSYKNMGSNLKGGMGGDRCNMGHIQGRGNRGRQGRQN